MLDFLRKLGNTQIGGSKRFKYTCPYCFDGFNKYKFKCINKRCPGGGSFVFEAAKMTDGGRKAECPKCHQSSFKRVCPFCENDLPESTLDGQNCIISIVGSRSSGKSHFIGVIIHELIKRIAPQINNGSFEGFGDSLERYKKVFENNLYQACQQLELTRSGINNVNVSLPYIFNYKFRSEKNKKIKCYTFVFFDTAGEDLNDIGTMSTVNKYICKSSGIIFLLDPMGIPGLVSKLDSGWVLRASGGGVIGTSADDIITRVSQLIRSEQGLSETDKIKIPVAAVFSKYDAFESIIPEELTTIKNPSPHCKEGRFIDADAKAVDSEIRALLNEWGANAFTSQLENNYEKYSYFTVSSLGLNNNPSSGRIKEPHPHRIEDPMLWLMSIGGKLQ